MTRFSSDDFEEGYWERGEGSNYQNYGDEVGWEPILDVMEGFRYSLSPGGNIRTMYEIACAKGWFVSHARDRRYDASGFDISEYAIANCAPAARPYIYVADAVEPFRESGKDCIVSWEFLEHVPEEHIDTVLRNIIDSVRPGGQIWLKICIFREEDDHDSTHVSVFPREWWEDKFRAFGLEHMGDAEALLDEKFAGRDWAGRFFVWRKPNS